MSTMNAEQDILSVCAGVTYTSPLTRGWTQVKEGYLVKTKLIRGMHKSQKLRWFVLFQHPRTRQARIEYYEGKRLKGSANLAGARAIPFPQGRFEVHTPTRVFFLQAEQGDTDTAAKWTVSIQQLIEEAASCESNPASTVPKTLSRPEIIAGNSSNALKVGGNATLPAKPTEPVKLGNTVQRYSDPSLLSNAAAPSPASSQPPRPGKAPVTAAPTGKGFAPQHSTNAKGGESGKRVSNTTVNLSADTFSESESDSEEQDAIPKTSKSDSAEDRAHWLAAKTKQGMRISAC